MRSRALARPGEDPAIHAVKQNVVDHYEARLLRFGASARGMDWKDEASQRLRFAALCDVCDLRGKSVHDVGSGAGHLLDYLIERGIDASYSGSDLSAKMVEAARRRHPDARFESRDLLRDPPEERFDVLLCSGLFHVKLDAADGVWWEFVRSMLRAMFDRCREAIAFNLMSDQVDFRSEILFYASPADTLKFCQSELSRFTTLRHDYPLYEYTIYVYRSPSTREARIGSAD